MLDPGEGHGGPDSPLFLDQTEWSQEGRENFFWDLVPPPLSQCLDERGPPLSEGLDLPLYRDGEVAIGSWSEERTRIEDILEAAH